MMEILRIRRAFTLIELLIVVAIIAILAAIALPNFLEAQTRAKVARVHADLRTIIGAIEAYRVDHNRYPPHSGTGPSTMSGEMKVRNRRPSQRQTGQARSEAGRSRSSRSSSRFEAAPSTMLAARHGCFQQQARDRELKMVFRA